MYFVNPPAPLDAISREVTHSTKQGVSKADRDGLGLGIIRESGLAEFPADATLLVPAKGKLMMDGVVGVDPDRARAEAVGHVDGGLEVGRVHGRREAICCGVAQPDGILFALEF